MLDQSIDLDGVSLAYRIHGSGDPMVLVHPSISDLRSWDPLVPLIAGHFRVINYSRRFAHPNAPIGETDDSGLTPHVDDLIALVEKLRFGKVHLVGSSAGAFICLLAARRRPDLVRSLTLAEPPVLSLFFQTLPPRPGEMFRLLLSSPPALLDFVSFGALTIAPSTKAFAQGKDDLGLDIFARGVLGEAAYAKLAADRRRQMVDNLKPHRAALLGSGLPIFTAADAAAIKVPTLLVRGIDTPGFQRRINQRLAELIPGSKDICIPNASHLVHEDNPHAVADLIRTFCKAN